MRGHVFAILHPSLSRCEGCQHLYDAWQTAGHDISWACVLQAVASFTRACGLGDIRTSKALHNLAGANFGNTANTKSSQHVLRLKTYKAYSGDSEG